MDSNKLRREFLSFFKENNHKIVSSSSLIPDDQTVLLTTAGMQQFVPYLSGEKDTFSVFNSIHLTSVQKCFRTPDIEEVGDDTHHTFFEMLGNWSMGGYFKEGAIDLAYDFFINKLKLDKERIWITIFKGDKDMPKDREAFDIWKKKGIPEERILEFSSKDNFWGPTSLTGPCGPSSEIHYDRGEEYGCKKGCSLGCDNCRRFVELWNLVFMEYRKNEDGSFSKLPKKNVDTGIGFERLLSVLQKKDSPYETDLFFPIIEKIEEISSKKYEENKKEFRVLSDHLRGAIFLISDGLIPGNTERGYILRRILRRMIRYGNILGIKGEDYRKIGDKVIDIYGSFYPEIKEDNFFIIEEEERKFLKTMNTGINELRKIFSTKKSYKEIGKDLFFIYQSYGLPLELSLEEIGEDLNEEIKESFKEEVLKHQDISRAGAEKKFGGVGDREDHEAIKLHTATHLLHKALRDLLGDDVRQMGSDINRERLRFDFSYNRKLTKEEIEEIERIINLKIKEDLEVGVKEMDYEEAIRKNALAFFKERYPKRVTVYNVGDYSMEICAGPHVRRTSEIGNFKIKKEESVGLGVRRIKAIINQ